ncbi:hypothetical protein [Massilia scottii]|uniref:hypothetical protein n=1 Tax=Massilia scottii TaxID=3057166 RepID=UPI002796A236|nr:hypothetical protein [Massilia sp. CCM 9029]MDQ1832752.1 hypothetical protein [Massilia sp. CCM 9029]
MNPARPCLALLAALLGACAGMPAPPPGTQVSAAQVASAIRPGESTRASLLASLGPTHKVRFDSGYEAWLYQLAVPGAGFDEIVVLLDAQGVVRKMRRRSHISGPAGEPIR